MLNNKIICINILVMYKIISIFAIAKLDMKLDNLHIINFEGCSEFRVPSSELFIF